MIDHRLTQADISQLKSLIGTKLICFKSEEKDSWNRIFGNIAIVTDKRVIEIRNELTPTEYIGGNIEDVSRFFVKPIDDEHPFALMIISDVVETSVNETITDIGIVTDGISVKDLNGNIIYKISTAESIIIKTDSSSYVISRDWHLEEVMYFIKTSDIQRDMRSVADIISDWSDEDENTVATCNRKEIFLKNS